MCGGLAKSVVIDENYQLYYRDTMFLKESEPISAGG